MNLNNLYKSIKSVYPQYNHDSIVQAMKKELTILNKPESLRVLANWDIHKDNLNLKFNSTDKPKENNSTDKPKENSNAPTNQWNFNEGSNSQNKFEVKTVNNYGMKRKEEGDIDSRNAKRQHDDNVDKFFDNDTPAIIIPQTIDEDDIPPLYMNSQGASIDIRPLSTCTYVGEFNVSVPFLNFISKVKEKLQTQGFFLETHFFEICGLSSILPLKKNQYPPSLLKHFTINELNMIQDKLIETLVPGYKKLEFNTDVLGDIRALVKSFLRGEIVFRTLRGLLDSLCDRITEDECRCIDALIAVIPMIPKEPIKTPLGEIELQSGYLQPVLGALFNNSDEDIIFRWPDKTMKENQEKNVNKRRRPDGQITLINQSEFGPALGFGEAKIEERRGDIFEMTRDLIRVSLFDKASIDKYYRNATLGFQCIGCKIDFYFMLLLGPGVYPFVQFTDFKVPLSYEDLTGFLNDFDQLLLVTKVFEKCKEVNNNINNDMKRKSFDSPSFRTYVSSTKNRHRPSTLNFKK